MPRELKTKDEFSEAAKSATEVRVVRSGENAKVKLRTPEGLLTFKTTGAGADALVKGLKTEVTEY
jgi:hypothetical protein